MPYFTVSAAVVFSVDLFPIRELSANLRIKLAFSYIFQMNSSKVILYNVLFKLLDV